MKGEALSLDATTLGRIRRDVLTRTKANAGRAAAEAAVMAALYARLPEDLDLDLEDMTELVSDSAAYKMFLQAWWPDLTATDVLRRLGSPRVVARVGEGILDAAEQAALAASYDEDDWTVADTALLDELVAVLGPIEEDEDEEPLLFLGEETRTTEVITTADWLRDVREIDPNADPHDTFAHVLVDEAQDISPMQWRMLRRRGSQASWTIVGDPAQSSWPDLDESARSLQELIGSAPHRDFRLSTNYRSPAEVFTLAAEVVRRAYADADLPVAIRTTGVEPLLLTAPEAELVGGARPTGGCARGERRGHDRRDRRAVPAGVAVVARDVGDRGDQRQRRAGRVPEPAQCEGPRVRRRDRRRTGRDRRRITGWGARALRRADPSDAAAGHP